MSEELLTMILIGVAIVLLAVLVFVAIEIIRTVRKVRRSLDDLLPSVNEAVTRVNTTMATLEPSLKRVDPLLERAALTVDAVNLEIMRVDQILADLTDVTDVASGAVKKVSGITEAPLNLLTSATDKIRNVFSDKRAEKRYVKALSEAEKSGRTRVSATDAEGHSGFVAVADDTNGPTQDLVESMLKRAQEKVEPIQRKAVPAFTETATEEIGQANTAAVAVEPVEAQGQAVVVEPVEHQVVEVESEPEPVTNQQKPTTMTPTVQAAAPVKKTIKPPSGSASTPPPGMTKMSPR